ncbi:hypothetical protein LBMAG42_10740 [Deltaproteobacteria bacterium]|nr:hypothetical protein LBMAG42_10740 [Deltaproteobacteria bacterium]
MVLLLLVACIDYLFEEEPRVWSGDLVATLSPIEAGVCPDTVATVTLENVGRGDLHITTLGVEGADWMLEAVDLPLVLAPGAEDPIHLTGSGGESTLVIRSDDPEQPEVQIPVGAAGNVTPVTLIVSPYEEQSVPVGADLALNAFVSDADDAVSDLTLEWVSSLTGSLGAATADENGRVEGLWLAADRESGPQLITLQARDACGGIGDGVQFFCQDGPFVVHPITEEAWHYEGAASISGDVLTLTEATPDRVGAAFDLISIFDGDRIDVSFSFQIGEGTGGEGLSVTLLDANERDGFVGGGGCGLGFGGGADCTSGPALPGWSLAIDTHTDPGDCVAGPHLAFTLDGDLRAFAPCAAIPAVDDGEWHDLKLSVADGALSVSLDGVSVLAEPVAGLVDFAGYLGFTASTSSATNAHRVRDVEIIDYTCE